MGYVTQDELRALLRKKLGSGTQAALARAIGVKPQNLSVQLQGLPIQGKVLAWLGYEAVNGLYQKRKP